MINENTEPMWKGLISNVPYFFKNQNIKKWQFFLVIFFKKFLEIIIINWNAVVFFILFLMPCVTLAKIYFSLLRLPWQLVFTLWISIERLLIAAIDHDEFECFILTNFLGKKTTVPVLLVPALDEISFKTARNTLFFAQCY